MKRIFNNRWSLLDTIRKKMHVRPHGKRAFLQQIIPNGKILDVGCGNNSPVIVKTLRPDCWYVGLDIGIYNQCNNFKDYMDEFILVEPEKFHMVIEQRPNEFDAVLSTHNLEHCNDYQSVLIAMLKSVNEGGYLHLAFPCEASVKFPKGRGFNFYEDPTHINVIPYEQTIDTIKSFGFDIVFTRRRYRPVIYFLLGLLYEPFGWISKTMISPTWDLYGFETVIIAKKRAYKE
jgi:SAM-dependent methyltransferase